MFPCLCIYLSGSNMHHSSSSSSMTAEEATRGVAVEKLETMKKWGLNTYKVSAVLSCRASSAGTRPSMSLWYNHRWQLHCVTDVSVRLLSLFQCTKQMISERFGRGSRTVDLELEAQIEVLRDTKRKYENVLRLARALTNHFYNMVQTQHALGDTFADLSQKSPELRVRPQDLFM